jgi:CheY-like chemotaxis protein
MRSEVNPLSRTALSPGASPRLGNMDEETVRVLLLEDSPSDALLIREALRDCPGHFAVTHVERLDAAIEHIAHHEADVILCDLDLPDASGLEAAQGMRSAAPSLPLIVMTRNHDEAKAAEALRQGAQDYLNKDDISNHSILRVIGFAIQRQRA